MSNPEQEQDNDKYHLTVSRETGEALKREVERKYAGRVYGTLGAEVERAIWRHIEHLREQNKNDEVALA